MSKESSVSYGEQVYDPIDWKADEEDVLLRKIKARYEDTGPLFDKKKKQYEENEAYVEGKPEKIDSARPKTIYNHLFPILRNMTGLITDVIPTPGVKITKIEEKTPAEKVQSILELGDKLERSLNEWWEDNSMQTWLQRLIFSLQTYDDFFIMPYWDSRKKEVCAHLVHPRHIRIDSAASDVEEAEYAVVDLYKTRKWCINEFNEDKVKDLRYMDYTEAQTRDSESATSDYKLLKNVAKICLYMEDGWFVYYSEDKLLKKYRNPYWAVDEAGQREDLEKSIRAKHEKQGMGKMMQKMGDAARSMVGMKTTDDKVEEEVAGALETFSPQQNFFTYPRIPIIQFDTYRMAGEQYSRSAIQQAIPTIDSMNKRKEAVDRNSDTIAEPGVYVSGGAVSEDDAKKIRHKSGQAIRIPTKTNQRIGDVIQIHQGQPLPAQFFTDMQHSERAIDNIFGHHEVSKGITDPRNKTKGGILALQEADQTPVRYLTRNLEASLQELFRWVVQIRKLYMDKVMVGDPVKHDYLDFSLINSHFKVYVKSGSMMPVSREQQRVDAREEFSMGLIDPLTYHERVNTPNAEKVAKRVEAWQRERRILTDDMNAAQQAVLAKIELIKQNKFEEAQMQETDDPRVHHDMLLMALKNNIFTPEQEQFVAQMIKQYANMAGQPIKTPMNDEQPEEAMGMQGQ